MRLDMEREKEIAKLVNVLYRIARGANYVVMTGSGDPQAARFCVAQYNGVLGRLTEIEPAVGQAFAPLAPGASPEVCRIAARELAAYFEDETQSAKGSRRSRRCGGARVWVGYNPASGRCW
jgi:hypothetical protein